MAPVKPRIVITYCTQCQWLLRAGWLAQELLSTFGVDLGEVALVPGIGGVFAIAYDGETIWDRKADGGFPDAKTLKRRGCGSDQAGLRQRSERQSSYCFHEPFFSCSLTKHP
jgi:selenoprotein W-related protein